MENPKGSEKELSRCFVLLADLKASKNFFIQIILVPALLFLDGSHCLLLPSFGLSFKDLLSALPGQASSSKKS